MATVRVLYDVPQWAYFQMAEALRKHAPSGFDVTVACWPDTRRDALDDTLGAEPPDYVIVNQFRHTPVLRAFIDAKGWDTRIASIWNVGWPRRTDALVRVLDAADGIIFINDEYWRNVGRLSHCCYIPHGADLGVFTPRRPVEERPTRVLWLGSQVNRQVKGYDQVIKPLERQLEALGFDCDFRIVDSNQGGALDAEGMADWYNSGRILLCASTSEGTPNVALEAAACGCVIVSTAVGNMPELIRHRENGMIAEPSVDAFAEAVVYADKHCTEMSKAVLTDIRAWGWDVLAPKVFEYLSDLKPRIACRSADASDSFVIAGCADGADISDDVTVFVSTVGGQTFDACLDLLWRQNCRFRLRIVRDVAPLSAAFQRMMDECETPFYVQVDEDMLLYPKAVRTLYEGLRGQPETTAIHVHTLFDADVGINIYGIKIFRHDVVRRYPFANVEGCDVDQNRRLHADGYTVSLAGPVGGDSPDPATLGLHGTVYAPREAFYRYLKLSGMVRREGRSLGWETLPDRLVQSVRDEPSAKNVYGLLGYMAGAVLPRDAANGEKDFRMQGRSRGFELLEQFYAEVSCGR